MAGGALHDGDGFAKQRSGGGRLYLIPEAAVGEWAGKGGQIAIRDDDAWVYVSPQDGHGIGLPDGSVYVREMGEYKLLRFLFQNWFDLRYSRFSEPPVDTFYVNAATGDDNNDGMSEAAAFKTIQGAVDALSAKYITFAQITVQVAPGEYGGVTISPSLISNWKFIGDKDNPASTVINATSLDVNFGRGFTIYSGQASIEGFKFLSYYENIAATGSTLTARNCHITMTAAGSAVASWGGKIYLYGTHNIYGQGSVIFSAGVGGSLQVGHHDAAISEGCSLIYHNVVATYNFTAATAGTLTFYSNVVWFSGSLNAKKYLAYMNGVIHTEGAGGNWIYGNQVGGVSSGGQVN